MSTARQVAHEAPAQAVAVALPGFFAVNAPARQVHLGEKGVTGKFGIDFGEVQHIGLRQRLLLQPRRR